MTGPLVVRPARPEDLPAVSKMGAELARLHHRMDAARFMLIEPLEQGYEWFFSQELDNRDALILVAEIDGKIAGYAYGTLEPRDWNDLLDACGKLNDLYVDPTARRGGVGRALVTETFTALRGRGAPRVVLLSGWKNPDAHAFFESLGFRKTMVEMTAEI